ncbi:hypothetical protein NM208_g913 [Fusarium decemcellulare]|uniref:Uncharacterized protein n=1 Tax=Fusarium decemcellulare TaxID=57161 RepID=A0ACC1SXQ5_9HYPO|nr:hypothetical protein NM208_g913 [Fusarium decemcellulare]
MMFKPSILVAFIPALVAGKPLTADESLEARQQCLVNRSQIDLWVEDGLSRWRIAFSAEGTDPAGYCYYWINHTQFEGCRTLFNPQCYVNDVVGSWVVDVSSFRGPSGDADFRGCYDRSLAQWMDDTGCATG